MVSVEYQLADAYDALDKCRTHEQVDVIEKLIYELRDTLTDKKPKVNYRPKKFCDLEEEKLD